MSRNKIKFVVNPDTNRNVIVGGKTWMKLVKKGILERGDYLPPNCAYKLKKEEYENDEEAMAELEAEKERMIKNNEVPKGVEPIIGMGNQIYYKTPKTTVKQSAKLTSDAALDVIDQIQNGDIDIPTDMNRDEARDYLQGLIFNQMLAKKKKFKNPKLEPKKITRVKKPVKKKQTNTSNHPHDKYGTASMLRHRPHLKKPTNIRQHPKGRETITRIPKQSTNSESGLRKREQVYFIENSNDYIDAKVSPQMPHDINSEDEYEYEYVDVEVNDDVIYEYE